MYFSSWCLDLKILAVAVGFVVLGLLCLVLFGGFDFGVLEGEKVFVGVSYGGDSVSEGKLLIDRVKSYSNLFVLQSGSLQRNLESVDELGDYAISSGLYFLPYFGSIVEVTFFDWIERAKHRWGDWFLGVYFGDEPGGKMLDDYVEFEDTLTGDHVIKTRYGDVVLERDDGVVVHYEISGVIHLFEPEIDRYSTFFSNGSVIVDGGDIFFGVEFADYEDLISVRPFYDVDDAAERFLGREHERLLSLKENLVEVFTSDYGLYWFDYLAGYDVVLGQLGWNHTLNWQIGLVRGAAISQNRDWGVVVTWKYDRSPYLDSGSEILDQLTISYEAGAKYFVLFNYYENNGNVYGTLKDEHFLALESFWNDVVINSGVVGGSVEACLLYTSPSPRDRS